MTSKPEGGENDKCDITDDHCNASGSAHIHKIRFDSLCGMDGRESFPTTIRNGHAEAHWMVCEEICKGFI